MNNPLPQTSCEGCDKRAFEIARLNKEIQLLREDASRKHDEISTKWRNQAIYYRKKCKKLESILVSNEIPFSTAHLKTIGKELPYEGRNQEETDSTIQQAKETKDKESLSDYKEEI